jgi:trk system potassium uptake protein TrkH
VNFTCYYLLIIRQVKSVLKDEELRLYLGLVLGSVLLIAWNLRGFYDTVEETFRHSAFQVASVITTTGFATTDFDQWPTFSKSILLCLMLVGACAGSTGGGFKCGRLLLLVKNLHRNIRRILNPQRVQVVRNNDRAVGEKTLDTINNYLAAYVMIIAISFIVVSLDGYSPPCWPASITSAPALRRWGPPATLAASPCSPSWCSSPICWRDGWRSSPFLSWAPAPPGG